MEMRSRVKRGGRLKIGGARCPTTVERPCFCLAQADAGTISKKKCPCEAPLARGWLGKNGPCSRCSGRAVWGQCEGSKTQKPHFNFNHHDKPPRAIPSNVLLFCPFFIIPLGREDSLCMLYPPGYLPIPPRKLSRSMFLDHLRRDSQTVASSNHRKHQNRDGGMVGIVRRQAQEALPSPSVTVSQPNAAVMCELLFDALPHLPSPFRVLVTSRRDRLTLGAEMDLVTFFAYLSGIP
jgi:hypothetical protein